MHSEPDGLSSEGDPFEVADEDAVGVDLCAPESAPETA